MANNMGGKRVENEQKMIDHPGERIASGNWRATEAKEVKDN